MDDRLQLICGPDCANSPENPEHLINVREFAAARGWTVTKATEGLVFCLSE